MSSRCRLVRRSCNRRLAASKDRNGSARFGSMESRRQSRQLWLPRPWYTLCRHSRSQRDFSLLRKQSVRYPPSFGIPRIIAFLHRQFLEVRVGAGGGITSVNRDFAPRTTNSTPISNFAGKNLLHLFFGERLHRITSINDDGNTVVGDDRWLHVNALGLRCAYFGCFGAAAGHSDLRRAVDDRR